MNDGILKAVIAHHRLVEKMCEVKGSIVLMTVLIGSQVYGLDNPNSDYDTFSFVLPSYLSFIRGDAPESYEVEVDDGKCCVKDLRLALNLLRKPSPNSVECWVSPYKVFNDTYKKVFDRFLDPEVLFFMTHCSYKNMSDATAGTCRGLRGRNMSLGKKVSHALRLHSMMPLYIEGRVSPPEYFKMPNNILKTARMFKEYGNEMTEEELSHIYDLTCQWFDNLKEEFDYDDATIHKVEEVGRNTVDNFQLALMKIYFETCIK